VQDERYSVVALVDGTPTSGNYKQVVERFEYTPYGEVTVLDANFALDGAGHAASDFDWTHLFTGRAVETDTGLQIHRWRHYHPSLGRWVARDPIGYAAGFNLYGYVRGAVMFAIDPFGLDEIFLWIDTLPGIGGGSPAADAPPGGLPTGLIPLPPSAFVPKIDLSPPLSPHGDVVKWYYKTSFWYDYNYLLARGEIQPDRWTRIGSGFWQMVLPPSERTLVRIYEDGYTEYVDGGGPTSGGLGSQASIIQGGGRAACAAAGGTTKVITRIIGGGAKKLSSNCLGLCESP